jgi:hypothetical protein
MNPEKEIIYLKSLCLYNLKKYKECESILDSILFDKE